ncbi:tenomodulin isoform X2 [Ictalurus furcatus]|uniref:tenomodulin isoform X2 n=1 Tax=Ictalurus furcatus TaxID=66913 RepID=UPI00234FF4BC|nr:tenomodulin isoform X2 [Ictalurus furcatus]
MENDSHSSSQQALHTDVELGKKKNAGYCSYHCVGLILGLVFLMLTLCVFSLRYIWSTSPGKMYTYEYKAVLDGVETDSMMEINPAKQLEILRVGNGSEEVLEIHDFRNGLTGIHFAKHQRCYIRTQTRELPKLPKVDLKKADYEVDEPGEVDMQMVDSYVWIPAKQPINNRAFLQNSKIWEICQELPIHWIHLSPLRDATFSDVEDVKMQDTLDTQAHAVRQARDVMDELPVNDYQDNAPCHTARSIKVWMEDHQIKTRSLPAQSRDLNPIENLWNVITKKIGAIQRSRAA